MVILVEEEASFSLELINGSAENEAATKVPNLITFSREAERFVCLSPLFVSPLAYSLYSLPKSHF